MTYLEKNYSISISRLKTLRKFHGLTQDHIALGCGISRPYYNKIEKGYSEPKASVLVKIAEILKVKTDELFTPVIDGVDMLAEKDKQLQDIVNEIYEEVRDKQLRKQTCHNVYVVVEKEKLACFGSRLIISNIPYETKLDECGDGIAVISKLSMPLSKEEFKNIVKKGMQEFGDKVNISQHAKMHFYISRECAEDIFGDN